MVHVVATRKIPYGRRHVPAGETFEASEKDAKLFLKLGWATGSRPTSLEVPRGLQSMTAPPAAQQDGEAAPGAPAHPQMYNRRDMAADPLAGPTGEAKPSSSSRPGRPRKVAT